MIPEPPAFFSSPLFYRLCSVACFVTGVITSFMKTKGDGTPITHADVVLIFLFAFLLDAKADLVELKNEFKRKE